MERLPELARDIGVDIALVSPEESVHAAAQYARKGAAPWVDRALDKVARGLGEKARNGGLALFLGAGVSIPAGLMSWSALIDRLAQELAVEEYDNSAAPLTLVDQAELIQHRKPRKFRKRVVQATAEAKRPSLLHALLAGLNCAEVVTTNYDQLYEEAVRAAGREVASVMPRQNARGVARWVLKMHGDVEDSTSIVLTRRSMVRYDATNRPSGAVLQSLLLTKHLLVVGASMTDDNIIRLAHEVDAYRTKYEAPIDGQAWEVGAVLDAAGDGIRQALWEGQFAWVDLTGRGSWLGWRMIELFLDRVAFHASRSSSWLLDSRFSSLLQDAVDGQLADRARELYESLPKGGSSKWAPLTKSLEGLGATGRHV